MSNVVPLDLTDVVDPDQLTEGRVARLFANEYTGKLAYCHSRGGWYLFDGYIWRWQETPIAFHYTRELAERLSLKAKKLRSTLQKSTFCAGVEKFAKADPIFAATARDWDQDIWMLGTPEGVVDLKTGTLNVRVDPALRITKATSVTPSPFDEPDCDRWLSFLNEATGADAAMIRFLQQLCGYALTGDISEQMLFFIFGPGGNGKGTFLRALEGILGDYVAVATAETLEKQKFSAHTTDLAMMQGARLVSASETDEGSTWNEKRIKSLTGGDKITARFMHRNNVTFTPQLTLLIIGNHKPSLTAVDASIRRRFNMIPFTIEPKRIDKHLDDKIQLEWPEILRWMINGCLDWQANGFVIPDIVRGATEEYFEEQDVFGDWLKTYCEVDRTNEHLSELSSRLFTSWQKFSLSQGATPGTAMTFKPALQRIGLKWKRSTQGVFFHGIRLKNDQHTDVNYDVF